MPGEVHVLHDGQCSWLSLSDVWGADFLVERFAHLSFFLQLSPERRHRLVVQHLRYMTVETGTKLASHVRACHSFYENLHTVIP